MMTSFCLQITMILQRYIAVSYLWKVTYVKNFAAFLLHKLDMRCLVDYSKGGSSVPCKFENYLKKN